MFLEHLVTLGFMSHDLESRIFFAFPVSARRVFAKEACDNLLKGQTKPGDLTTHQHVKTIMELVGQAFDIPLDDGGSAIINLAASLYRKWLLDDNEKPAPLLADEQYFYRQMFRHLSQIFRPRNGTLDAHVKLCNNVLSIFENASRDLGSRFSEATWEELLRILLGICDSLLRAKVTEEPLADRLQARLLGVLMLVWLRSGTQNADLWDTCKRLMGAWRHRVQTVKQWNVTCMGLLNRVFDLLYGPSYGHKSVVLSIDEEEVELEMEDDHVLFSWFRMLHMLGDLEQIDPPPNYHEAMRGVAAITAALVELEDKTKLDLEAPKPPDGNSILHIVGPFLLDAIAAYPEEKVQGKAVALQAACSLFISKVPITAFHPTYLAMFYRGVEAALKSESNHLLSVICLNCTELFHRDFIGVRILVPSFVVALSRVIGRDALPGIVCSPVEMHRVALRILASLLCLAKNFGSTSFKSIAPLTTTEPSLPALESYAALNAHLEHILAQGLDTLSDPGNQATHLWLMHAYFVEHADVAPDFVRSQVTQQLHKLVAGKWSLPVVLTCLQSVAALSELHTLVNQGDALAPQVITSMFTLIEKHVTVSTHPQPPPEELVVHALHCLCRWVLINQWLVSDSAMLLRFWEVVEVCLTGRLGSRSGSTFHPPSPKTKVAASHVMHSVMAFFGHWSNPEAMCSLAREKDILSKPPLSPASLSCFIFDNQLFSVIRYPKENGELKNTVIIRNPLGRFVWHVHMNFFVQPWKAPDPLPVESDNVIPSIPGVVEKSTDFLSTLTTFLDEAGRQMHDKLLEEAQQRTVRQAETLRQRSFGLDADTTLKRRALPDYDPKVHETVALRSLLSHMGFVSMANKDRMRWIQTEEMLEYLTGLDQLDQLPARENYSVGVLYVTREAATRHDVLAFAETGSLEYQTFVRGLGWSVDLATHNGFRGVLDAEATGPTSRYYADSDHEVMFHVGSLMSAASPAVKEPMFEAEVVLVLWVEDQYGWDGTLLDMKTPVTIVVHPLPSGLFLVKVGTSSPQIPAFGPLQGHVVVSGHSLPNLVRWTAVNAVRAVASMKSGVPFLPQQSLVQRSKALEKTISMFRSKPVGFVQRMSALFQKIV